MNGKSLKGQVSVIGAIIAKCLYLFTQKDAVLSASIRGVNLAADESEYAFARSSLASSLP